MNKWCSKDSTQSSFSAIKGRWVTCLGLWNIGGPYTPILILLQGGQMNQLDQWDHFIPVAGSGRRFWLELGQLKFMVTKNKTNREEKRQQRKSVTNGFIWAPGQSWLKVMYPWISITLEVIQSHSIWTGFLL